MKRMLAYAIAASMLAAPALAAPEVPVTAYAFDKEHTSIGFSVSHLGYSNMVGRFMEYDGQFTFDEKNPKKSSVDVTIRPAGVSTISTKLDEYLQGADFFNTAKFPDVRFTSTAIKITGAKQADITGNLTLLGVTKPVTLKARFNKAEPNPISQQYIAGFSADAVVKRSEFGMSKYVPMVGDEVRIHIEVEAARQDPIKPEAAGKKR